jgi:hypothetical protein
MRSHTTSALWGNRILTVLGILFAVASSGTAQTVTWSGADGNFWTRNESWQGNLAPNINQIAQFGTLGSGAIAFRESSSPDAIPVGGIVIASSNFSGFTSGQPSATVQFGSNAAIRLQQASLFTFGDLNGANPRVSAAIADSGSLTVQVAPGSLLELNANISGTGSVVRLENSAPGVQTPIISVGSDLNGSDIQSTYTGGTWLGPDLDVRVRNSTILSSGSVESGPLGRGTVSLNGAELSFYGGQAAGTFGNSIHVLADSRLNQSVDTDP